MSNIDQVIARSRQPGSFTEKKKFTVARQRALQKMRKFALAHPAYYIVELIQAAIANNATYVDIDIERTSMVLSYIGGQFSEDQLGQLFDFLFASKESLALADVRQLALGVNALLLADPREVVIESGDGTLEGTTRIQIDAKKSSVEVGTPTEALNGTYVRATDLKRGKLGTGLLGPKELDVIENRCLAAPVPIIVNTEPIFGYTSQRTPRLFGCDRQISFDEGDLYGTIGNSVYEGDNSDFRLLTYGVWVESIKHPLLPGFSLGGVVCFDRLHKTADHAAIVRDERLEEMWARLLPYARQLKSGRTGTASFDVTLLSGERMSTAQLRSLLKESKGAVVVPRFEGNDPQAKMDAQTMARYRRAHAYGEALELPVLVRGQEKLETLRMLAGAGARLIEPDVDDMAELTFYSKPKAEPPARPWLIGEVELETVPVKTLVDVLESEGYFSENADNLRAQRRWVLDALGASSEIKARIYTPIETHVGADLWVMVRTMDRLLWEGRLRSPFPGHVLVIDAPDLSPRILEHGVLFSEKLKSMVDPRDGHTLAALIGAGVSTVALEPLEGATNRVLASLEHLDVAPRSAAAKIVLTALTRSAIKRLRSRDDEVGVVFSLLDDEIPEVALDVPVFEALDGTARTARDLERLMQETGGLVYGVIPDVNNDLEGLYPPRILRFEPEEEQLVISLLGEASYVRVDCRDELAAADGLRCRDIAVGLRSYPDFPLLVEGADPSGWPEERRRAALTALVGQLVEGFQGVFTDEELRRQAARHLIWYLYRQHASGAAAEIDPRVAALPLFLSVDGEACSFARIRDVLLSETGLPMHDGWAVDTADLGALLFAKESEGAVRGLAMNPFVFHALSRVGRVRPALDIDLSTTQGEPSTDADEVAYLVDEAVEDAFVEGVVGVPREPVENPVVLVFDRRTQRVTSLAGPARELGVVGRLAMKRQLHEGDHEHLERLVWNAGLQAMESLIEQIPALEEGTPTQQRSLAVVLGFAERFLSLTAQHDGGVAMHVQLPEARVVLEMPLFPTKAGVAVSANRLLRRWMSARKSGVSYEITAELAEGVSPLLRGWIARIVGEDRIARPAAMYEEDRPRASLSTPTAHSRDELAVWLTETLAALRTDEMGSANPTRVVFALLGDDKKTFFVGGTPLRAMTGEQLHLFCHLGGEPHLVLNGEHWLVQRTLQRAAVDPEAAVWLLFACYAHINDMLEPVTNEHELEFHRRVVELLERGELESIPQGQ